MVLQNVWGAQFFLDTVYKINFFNHVNHTINFLNHGFNATFCLLHFFSLFVFHLQVDVVGPLLLNASPLLVLMTDHSD